MRGEPLDAETIVSATEEMLRRHGPDKTTVLDVARQLGVSHGSVYRHFPSKAALREAVIRRWLDQVRDELAAAARNSALPPAERLRALLTVMFAIEVGEGQGGPGTVRHLPGTGRRAQHGVLRPCRLPGRPDPGHHRRRCRRRRLRRRRPGGDRTGRPERDEPLPRPDARRGVALPRDRSGCRRRSSRSSWTGSGPGHTPRPVGHDGWLDPDDEAQIPCPEADSGPRLAGRAGGG